MKQEADRESHGCDSEGARRTDLCERADGLAAAQPVGEHKPGEEDSPLGRLSDRELEIFSMIGRGLGTREIATSCI